MGLVNPVGGMLDSVDRNLNVYAQNAGLCFEEFEHYMVPE